MTADAITVITRREVPSRRKATMRGGGNLDLGWGVKKGFQETAEVEAGSTRQKVVGGKFQADETARAER